MLSTLLHLLRLLTTPDVTELQQCVLENQQFLSLHVLRYRDKIPGTLLGQVRCSARYAAGPGTLLTRLTFVRPDLYM